MSKSSGGIRRVGDRVPMDVAVERALDLLRLHYHRDVLASEIGYAVWPGSKFLDPQGAALAAGRIIGELRRRKLIRSSGRGWGLR